MNYVLFRISENAETVIFCNVTEIFLVFSIMPTKKGSKSFLSHEVAAYQCKSATPSRQGKYLNLCLTHWITFLSKVC